ncbi:hypothetical protein [Sedimenticola hydrogenitrophicus]|uniref:hypothetical protein n=1 Tax=Sedimenticola hydrogenitrophicus TaxID=2967975 RepID=UPI0021A7DC4F|nr:hypothetical protein [Sedimenticola hydrogenitrophicus]
MANDNNRILLEIDKIIRELNREIINPAFQELTVADLSPVLKLVARARSAYLKELLDIAHIAGDGLPPPEQVKQLQRLRLTFEELVKGSQAIETAIQRGYLDVKPR